MTQKRLRFGETREKLIMEKKSESITVRMSAAQRAQVEAFAAYRFGVDAGNVSDAIRWLIDKGLQMEKPNIAPGKYGDVAEFKSADGQKRFGVRPIPFRARPCLVVFDASTWDSVTLEAARGVDPLLDDVPKFLYEEGPYSWDTPRYRELCERLGFDPDEGRPRFTPAAHEVGDRLQALAETSMRSSAYYRASLAFDLIDLLRTDRDAPTPYSVWKAERDVVAIDEDDPNRALFDEAVGLVDRSRLAQPTFEEALTVIVFLPTASGRGYSATISGGLETSDADGWDYDMHAGLTGVALEPEAGAPWTTTARKKLANLHGVIFLTQEQARDYMDAEGSYWAWRHGGCCVPRGLEPLAPTFSEELVWRIKKPATPLSDQAHSFAQKSRFSGQAESGT